MIAYFDTSAVVPMLLPEPGTIVARECWMAARRVLTAQVTYPEARAALASATRARRLSRPGLARAVSGLDALDEAMVVIDLDRSLARRAGQLAQSHALRGYDAVQLASAERAAEPDAVFVSGDALLLGAAHRLGLTTVSTAP